MLVRFKRLHPDAVVPFKTYPEDFCYDVVATSEQEIAPNVWKYGIGLAFEIGGKPDDDVLVSESRRKAPTARLTQKKQPP